MKLLLLFSTPLAGAILLSLVTPGWTGSKELFSAGGRAFFWFWLAQGISYLLNDSGLYGVTVAETLIQRWSVRELPQTLLFLSGIMIWKVPRKNVDDTDSLIRGVLVFSAVFHLFNGAAEAIIHFNRFEPVILFAIPFALIGAMLFAALAGLFFIGFSSWLRWLLFPVTALVGSVFSVVPHALYSENLELKGGIVALLIPIIATIGLFLTLRYLFTLEHDPSNGAITAKGPAEGGEDTEDGAGIGDTVTTIVKQYSVSPK